MEKVYNDIRSTSGVSEHLRKDSRAFKESVDSYLPFGVEVRSMNEESGGYDAEVQPRLGD